MKASHVAARIEQPARLQIRLAALAGLALFTTTAHANPGGDPPLAAGPFGVLQAVLKKTFLQVEVARVQIRVDSETQRRLSMIAEGRRESRVLDGGAVRAVMQAHDVLITSELLRDVPFDRYSEAVYSDLRAARAAELVSQDAYASIIRLLPEWLRSLQARGVHKGDRFLCRVGPDSMRALYRSREGRTLFDANIASGAPGRAVLAGYLAPDSSFRKELLSSLFRDNPR
jgi:hypothetical protein